LVLLGDGVDGIEDAGEVPEDGEQEADPELMLQEKKNEKSVPNENLLLLSEQRTINTCTCKERKESDFSAYPATELEEDAEGREDDGDDDVDAGGRAHDRSPFLILMNSSSPCR
jgi:hypothetical protein